MFSHAVEDDLISREDFQSLFVAVEEFLNSSHRVQLFGPFKQSEPERILKNNGSLYLVPLSHVNTNTISANGEENRVRTTWHEAKTTFLGAAYIIIMLKKTMLYFQQKSFQSKGAKEHLN